MNLAWHFVIIIALGVVYWFGSLFIASELEAGLLEPYGGQAQGHYTQQGGFEVSVSVSESVQVSVKRPRWYGTIDEFSVDGKTSRYLALFDTLPVPLEARGTKFYPMHLLAGFGLFLYGVGAVALSATKKQTTKQISTKEVRNENLG